MRRHLVTLVGGWVAWLLLAGSAFAAETQWVEVKSSHFSVVTDGGEKRGREVAVRFEQMRAVFGALLVQSNVNLPVPLQIVAFRNTKELRQFAPLWNGKPTEVAGLFLGNTDRSFILLDLSVENPWAVVFHEYAHQLMDGNLSKRMDPWFEEGFAEYFASIEVDGKQARVGKIPEDTYRILQQTGLMKTADLLRVQQNSRTYNESGDRRTGFYAQSAMVVHYLYDNNLIPKLSTYFELVDDKKVPVEEAIQQSFGMNASQFDKTLRNYVSDGRYKYYQLPTPAGIVTTNYVTNALSAADSSAVLADVHLHSPDYGQKAMEEYQAILKTDGKNPSALRGLGYAYLLKQDFEEAGKYFRQAAEGDSKDPRVHYYAALLMSRERTLGNAANIPIMTKELETSIALDSNYADAYSLLAFAYAYAGDPAKGLQSMRKAIALSPRNETYIYNLAQMYLNNRNPDAAIPLFQFLQNAHNPSLATQATTMMEQAQEMKAALASGTSPVMSGMVLVEKEESPVASSEKATAAQQETKGATSDEASPAAPVTATMRHIVKEPIIKAEMKTPVASAPPRFVKGSVASVDCDASPGATLNLKAGARTLKLHVPDTRHVIVIGADGFSCSWTNQKLAVNYVETRPGEGQVMSIEVQ
jgi:Flp pilus assembly protein TadD